MILHENPRSALECGSGVAAFDSKRKRWRRVGRGGTGVGIHSRRWAPRLRGGDNERQGSSHSRGSGNPQPTLDPRLRGGDSGRHTGTRARLGWVYPNIVGEWSAMLSLPREVR
jgi:hypothetical protein